LREFIESEPEVRVEIATFLLLQSKLVGSESKVIDIGAGDSPYREFFNTASYKTVDWNENAPTSPERIDVIASTYEVPLPSQSADLVIMTEVLEHTSSPSSALREAARLLRPKGRIIGTTPFAWEFHEMPHDFYRYTSSAIAMLLAKSGFADVRIEERGCALDTAKVVASRCSAVLSRDPRPEVRDAARKLTESLAEIDRLDVEAALSSVRFPIGLSFTATLADAPE
jgi:SAM-dependent methyltransferase